MASQRAPSAAENVTCNHIVIGSSTDPRPQAFSRVEAMANRHRQLFSTGSLSLHVASFHSRQAYNQQADHTATPYITYLLFIKERLQNASFRAKRSR
ncbi:translation termination factor eRF1 [Cymbomonas tetramitiformis]|uniref:Translation termination factor eRF1 n=1 Tax=Cymbomonas tetramitiformis TaxID=36881 RepID=A0AAE0ET81_9CHLO|nr:translation termination factor eRF1 [Cymbomonas tetramitiformis]